MMAVALLKRGLLGLAQIAALIALVFFAIRALPADPVARFVGFNASPEAYAAAQAKLGLDQALSVQGARFVGLEGGDGLLQGSLGASWVSGAPVVAEIAQALPATLELVILSFLLALLIAVPIGAYCARHPGGKVDKGTMLYGLFAGSQPEFTWGLIFIFVFFSTLGIAPGPIGRLSPLTEPPDPITGFMTLDALFAGRPDIFAEALWYLALPVATLAFVLSGPIIKVVRDNALRALQSDVVLFARANGLPNAQIGDIALRAAAAPALTIIGVLFGFMLGGAVLVEAMFSLGGLGQYAIRSILAFDYPAIQGVVLVVSAISLLVYLGVDLAQAWLDPRVRL